MNKFMRIMYAGSNYILAPISVPIAICYGMYYNYKWNKKYNERGGYRDAVSAILEGMFIAYKIHMLFIKGEITSEEYNEFFNNVWERLL